MRDPGVYQRAAVDLEAFWAEAAEGLHWFRRWDRVLEWNAPWAKWFQGGLLNACYNCVDRHVLTARRNKAALIWEGEPGDEREQYWTRFPGIYFTGDGARRDSDGYCWLLGRVDDVLNVAGHRIGTMEIESTLVSHPTVAEAAVIGISHELKGQAVAAFVTPRQGAEAGAALAEELREHVAKKIGAIARPHKVFFTAELPKTRSAKIMRRLLRDVAEGRVLGDTTTLTDPTILAEIRQQYEESEG